VEAAVKVLYAAPNIKGDEMSKTPRTDALVAEHCSFPMRPLAKVLESVILHARDLERENARLREALERLVTTHSEDIDMDEYADGESVGWEGGKPMKLTFGDLRNARAALKGDGKVNRVSAALVRLQERNETQAATIAALRAEVDALRVDAERMDCLQSRMLAIDFDYGEKHEHALVFKWGDSPVMANLRMTVDAARKETK